MSNGGPPYAGAWSKPKITYTRADASEVSLTFSMFADYSWHWTSKAAHKVFDGGVVEKQRFHQRKVHRLSFEMLAQNEADWIRQWWNERAAAGNSFTFYRFSDSSPGVTCIWSPGETEPKVDNMDESPIWWIWDVELWEVLS